MGFFSNGKQENPEEKKAVQEVAMRTMQQDLIIAKKGELAGQTKMESVERHGGGLRQEKTVAKVAPPIAPVALPHLAEMEHRKEKSDTDIPEIKSIPVAPISPAGPVSIAELPNTDVSPNIPVPPSKQMPAPKPFSSEPVKIARPAEISKPVGSDNLPKDLIASKPSVPLPPIKPESPTDEVKSEKPKPKAEGLMGETMVNKQKTGTSILEKIQRNKKKITYGLVGGIAVVAIVIGCYFIVPMIFTPKTSNTSVVISDIPETPTIIPELPDIPNIPEIVENDFKLVDFNLEYDIDVDQDEFIDYYQNDISSIITEKLNVQDLVLAQEFVDIQFSIDKEFPPAEIIVGGILNNFPQDITDRMTSNYNLVAYSESDSGRLGLILEVNDVQAVQEILSDWERTMATDLAVLYFNNSLNLEDASSEDFIENIYSDVSIKYRNFPSPDVAIEYAVVGNKLIFATSKNSMLALVDYIVSADDGVLEEKDQ